MKNIQIYSNSFRFFSTRFHMLECTFFWWSVCWLSVAREREFRALGQCVSLAMYINENVHELQEQTIKIELNWRLLENRR